MAGSATITGRQNYVLGIGHPKNEAPTEGAPAVFSADGKSLVGVDGFPKIGFGLDNNPLTLIKPNGSFEQSAGVLGYTLSSTYVSAVPFYGFRIKYFGLATTNQINCVAGAAASKNMTGGIWAATESPVQITVGGATSWTIPAAVSGSGANAFWSETISDWITCKSVERDDGEDGYLLTVRVFIPSAGNTECGRSAGLSSVKDGVNSYLVGAVAGTLDKTFANWATFSKSVDGIGAPIGIEILTYGSNKTLATFGDSTIAGQDGAVSNGNGAVIAVAALNAEGKKICIWNQAEASMNSNTFVPLAENFLSSAKPNIAAMCPWSPNDTDKYTASGTTRVLAGTQRFLAACRKSGAFAVLVTPCPVGGITSAQEAFRREAVAEIKQIAANFSVPLVDRDAIYTDYSVPEGGWLPGMNFNTVHPSPAGYAAESLLWKEVLQHFC